jgi:hypothetical protein
MIRHLKPQSGVDWGSQLVFSPDGETLAVADHKGILRYIDASTGAERRIIRNAFPWAHQDGIAGITSVWISRDLQRAATAVRLGTTQMLIRSLPEGDQLRRVAFDGEVCAWSWPNLVVWVQKARGVGLALVSAVTGRVRVRIPGYYARYTPVVFSPDGRLLATLTEGYQEVTVRETATGRSIVTLPTRRVRSIAIAPDDRTLVATGESGLQVWDLATGKQRTQRSTREPGLGEIKPICKQVILTPDGQRAITDVIDGTGLVWDLNTFQTELLTHESSVNVDAWWADLAKDDAGTAYASMWRLGETSPEVVVPFLQKHLRPVLAPDAKVIQRSINDLGSEEFHTREAAMTRLAEFGPLAVKEVAQAASASESPEIRKRALELLNKMPDPIPKAETLRTLRAIAILERTGNLEARLVLTALAAGGSGARETEEAKAALGRFKLRGGKL